MAEGFPTSLRAQPVRDDERIAVPRNNHVRDLVNSVVRNTPPSKLCLADHAADSHAVFPFAETLEALRSVGNAVNLAVERIGPGALSACASDEFHARPVSGTRSISKTINPSQGREPWLCTIGHDFCRLSWSH